MGKFSYKSVDLIQLALDKYNKYEKLQYKVPKNIFVCKILPFLDLDNSRTATNGDEIFCIHAYLYQISKLELESNARLSSFSFASETMVSA